MQTLSIAEHQMPADKPTNNIFKATDDERFSPEKGLQSGPKHVFTHSSAGSRQLSLDSSAGSFKVRLVQSKSSIE